MAVQLPDPARAARQEAQRVNADRRQYVDGPLERVLNDAPFVDRESLLEGLEAFHRERMTRIPSPARYPETPPWVEHVLTRDRELQRLTGLSDQEMALYRSLGAYLTFRGFAAARPVMAERCRVAYLPESDHGQVHIKNVDDPCTFWKPTSEAPDSLLWDNDNLVQDGVGSGLHIDDEPEEIFPIEARAMLPHYADDVPGAIDFFTRYRSFWGGANIVIRDRQKRSAAIEKCSYNFIEVFHPGPDGRSHCSGMACRDPQSPQGRYQRAKREQYLTAFGQATDGPDQTFWDACDRAERVLDAGLRALGDEPKLADLLRLFRTPWPQGLSKEGAMLHPKQAVLEYTLITHAVLPDERRYLRWQRDAETLKMPEEAEEYRF